MFKITVFSWCVFLCFKFLWLTPFSFIFVACAGWGRQTLEKLNNTGFVLVFISQKSTCIVEVLFSYLLCDQVCAYVCTCDCPNRTVQ